MDFDCFVNTGAQGTIFPCPNNYSVSGSLLKLPAVQQLGDFADTSPTFFWLGWAVPLYMYEMVLAYRRKA